MGGVARRGPVFHGRPEEVVQEVREAMAQTGGRRLVVASECVLPVTVPEENLRALRGAVM
jgi:uroporphyrinogen decarboxylase